MDAKAWGEVVNIGTTNEVTIGDLARLVKERTGSKSPIQYVSYSQAYGTGYQDMSRRVPDVSKLKRLTGFVPNAHLFETIDRMAEHLRNEVVAVEVM
jgi:UDP-glucose 4-epimerase